LRFASGLHSLRSSSFRLLQDFGKLKFQLLHFLLVLLLVDGACFFLRFQVGDPVYQFFFPPDNVLAAFLPGHGFFVQLKRVADTPQQKSTNEREDKPLMRTHRVGHIGSARAFILRQEQ